MKTTFQSERRLTREILCTIGPASLNQPSLARLEAIGVSLFRINLSHTAIDDLPNAIAAIRRSSSVPICLDSEGAQVRTGTLPEDHVHLVEGEEVLFTAAAATVAGEIQLTPDACFRQLVLGDLVSIDFNSALVQLCSCAEDRAVGRVVQGGRIGSHKAVSINRALTLPAITPKDRAAIELGRRMGIRHFALSFANSAADVASMRELVGNDAFLMAKIESINGLSDLDAITAAADALLIDRGDLSREVPLERIPSAQKSIIAKAREKQKPVYVATNLLESMVTAPEPTRAEVNDIYNTLADGASGLVLAAETAIGRHPVKCAAMVRRVIEVWESDQEEGPQCSIPAGDIPERHWRDGDDSLRALPSIVIGVEQLMDAQQLALGGFAPLTGFQSEADVECVLDHNRTATGQPWTLPVILQVDASTLPNLPQSGAVALRGSDGLVYSVLDLEGSYRPDLASLSRRMFGTSSDRHPGAKRLQQGGNTLLAGGVALVRRLPFPSHAPTLSPRESRYIFAKKGWRRIVGFHSRNVVHRAHEFIQKQALDRVAADGLFLNPVGSPGRAGDFLPSVVLRSYRAAIDAQAYGHEGAVLGSFASWPRFAGPREAVFAAMVRRNMGCTHFIIGRDHSGVGDFYSPELLPQLLDSVGEIGIAPVTFAAVSYDPQSRTYVEDHENGIRISGTSVRDRLLRRESLPAWLVRPEVAKVLEDELAQGMPLFVE